VSISALAFLCVGFASTANANSFTTGVIENFQGADPIAFDNADKTGVRYLKNNVTWAYAVEGATDAKRPGTDAKPFVATDPASPYYHWRPIDQMVRDTAARGMQPVLTIVNAPKWAMGKCDDHVSCSPKPRDYADFATAAAKRYSGSFDPKDGQGVLPRVKYWQAWVEPNLYHFYSPIFRPNGSPVSPFNYRKILNAFYDAIHGVRNNNVVMAAGLAPNGVPGKAIAPLTFTRKILCMTGSWKKPKPKRGCKAKTKADVWSVHPYTTGAPTHLPDNSNNMSVAALPRMVALIKAANRSGRLVSSKRRTPVWATEFSWDTRPPDPGGLPSRLAARWVAQAMYIMYRANVRTLIWFGLRDMERPKGLPWRESFESGLYLRGKTIAKDKPKTLMKSFRFPFVANKTGFGFNYWGRTADSKPGRVAIFGRKKGSGRFVRVATARANKNGIFAGKVRRKGFTAKGAVRAKVNGQTSLAFGLNKTRDFFQPPFG
jgi:hypothetical protein